VPQIRCNQLSFSTAQDWREVPLDYPLLTEIDGSFSGRFCPRAHSLCSTCAPVLLNAGDLIIQSGNKMHNLTCAFALRSLLQRAHSWLRADVVVCCRSHPQSGQGGLQAGDPVGIPAVRVAPRAQHDRLAGRVLGMGLAGAKHAGQGAGFRFAVQCCGVRLLRIVARCFFLLPWLACRVAPRCCVVGFL
jgi:hypothetical protein